MHICKEYCGHCQFRVIAMKYEGGGATVLRIFLKLRKKSNLNCVTFAPFL